MGNPEVLAKWENTRRAIERELSGFERVVVRIPGWQPVDLDEGMSWLRINIYEGYYVGYRVEDDGTLWLKNWEFGEDEPDWPVVKAAPVRAADDRWGL